MVEFHCPKCNKTIERYHDESEHNHFCVKDDLMTSPTPKEELKPSKRIQQLINQEHTRKKARDYLDAVDIGLNAIVKYLDEQWEKDND